MGRLSTEFSPLQLLLGFSLAILIALLARRLRALSKSGAWAAAVTGGFIFGIGAISWSVLLLTFFISSSLLSRAFKQRKARLNEKYAKGSQRDWQQVFANGGLGVLLALAHGLWPHQAWLWLAYAGAMAAVNADTWATELGVLNPTAPRLITTGKTVERGTSGGVSFLGSLAALAGGLVVGGAAALFSPGLNRWELAVAAALGGLAGSSFDSLLGATLQGIYYCPACQKETERFPLHSCGTPTLQQRGWKVVNNEVVNFACSIVGALVTLGLWQLF
jgi:uncharacterized protein (TIGR00297 family)